MSLILRKDPDWPETLSTEVKEGSLMLLGADGCQVPVPATVLVAVSPLVKSMMADLLPPEYSPHVISIPAVTGAVLLMVAEVLTKGSAVVHGASGEVEEVFKMMKIQAFLSHSVADSEVKDEDLTRDCSESENYVKIENYDADKENEYYEDFSNMTAVKVEEKKIESALLWSKNSPTEVLLPFNENKIEEVHSRKEKKHMGTKTVEKPFACDQCPYRAAKRYTLKEHMATHTGQNPFACDQCAYKTARRYSFKEHMATHTGEKPFSCDQCPYSAVRRSNFKEHLLIHSKEKPFACDKCSYRAVRREAVKRHMLLTHTGEKHRKARKHGKK